MRDLYLIETKLFERMCLLQSYNVIVTCLETEVAFFNLLDVARNHI